MISFSGPGHVTSTGTKFLTGLNGSFETGYYAMTRSMCTIACSVNGYVYLEDQLVVPDC